jgi:hypothetical protein
MSDVIKLASIYKLTGSIEIVIPRIGTPSLNKGQNIFIFLSLSFWERAANFTKIFPG